jgi:hypothetical protein
LLKNLAPARLIQAVKGNAFVHEGFHAAFSLGGRRAAAPFGVLGLVGTATAQGSSANGSTIENRGGTSRGESFSLNDTNNRPGACSPHLSVENYSLHSASAAMAVPNLELPYEIG